ncbi:hypothetical protein [Chitinophaga sp. Cy-1792]|uniref:hypothetical protein n=1 Tax=Chitinophaga sp. Cy-1792 TaxID=2608339 RepID=UPI00141ECEE0|nr:hypothetical protein [Chitinophaga sp. Cy-1792]NIG54632.1 hypothetical protein [Chitinophaga sp. Cy-1792]
MKKLMLLTLLMGGTVLSSFAQRGYDRGYDRGRGHGWGHYKHCDDDRWERRRCDDRRWDDCHRPRRVVVYEERPVYYRPAYVPVVPVPVPVPPGRPRAVFHAGVTISN